MLSAFERMVTEDGGGGGGRNCISWVATSLWLDATKNVQWVFIFKTHYVETSDLEQYSEVEQYSGYYGETSQVEQYSGHYGETIEV